MAAVCIHHAHAKREPSNAAAKTITLKRMRVVPSKIVLTGSSTAWTDPRGFPATKLAARRILNRALDKGY